MARYYIFEDDERDDIQKLFYFPYLKNAKLVKISPDHFLLELNNHDILRWACGASNIKPIIETLSKDTEIFIFMDLVPDNSSTATLYRDIGNLRKSGYNVIVFPIPCAEYYMIKTLCDLQIQCLTPDIDVVLHREVYYDSSLFKASGRITTFEQYCKAVLRNMDMICTRKSNDEDREQNNLKGRFYRDNCRCADCTFRYPLKKKAEELLHRYPCIPLGAYMIYHVTRKLSREELIALHKKLVTEYNSAVDRYKAYTGLSSLKIPKSEKDFKCINFFDFTS